VRVLVVEDEVRMAGLLRRALKEEGHAVDVAVDGPQGLWLATENEYGAIVLDVMLPGMDGFQLCRRGVPVVSGLPAPPPLLPDARETVRACPLLALRLERMNR
jgi:two-component system OmpR family response regulator